MSRTNRNFPAQHAVASYAVKFGRDGQFSKGVASGVRNERYHLLNWVEAVASTPSAKRAGVKRLRAHQKRDTRAQFHAL